MKRTLEAINAVVLAFMFVIVLLSVIFRVVVAVSASWTEELAQYLLIFLGFIGAAALMRDEGHIAITLVVDRMSNRTRKTIKTINRLFMLPFFLILTVGAFENMQMNWEVGLPTVEWMKIGYMYLVVFLCGVIMTFYLLMNLCKEIFQRKTAATERGGAP